MATIGDIVLIHFEETPAFFARIEDISADKKPGWYHVKLLILQVPVTEVVWILRDVYIDGESFTMEGKKIRIERVRSSLVREGTFSGMSDQNAGEKQGSEPGKIISIFERKKG